MSQTEKGVAASCSVTASPFVMGFVPGLCGQWPALLQHEHQIEAYQPHSARVHQGKHKQQQKQQQHHCQL